MSTSGGGVISPGGGSELHHVVPKLVGGDVTFEPDVVTRLGGTLPWDTQSKQLQCGETVVTNNEDFNLRINYECEATHSEFKKLMWMRASPEEIKLVSPAYSGRVTFDELTFDRISESNARVDQAGENLEPMYKIQLQSKEESE